MVKPASPAFGLEPRPTAPSSRISPPEPVAAPGYGAIAVGWLCVSTLMSVCTGSATGRYTPVPGSAKKRLACVPSMTAALSEYADRMPAPLMCRYVLRIIPNSVSPDRFPSISQLALKILCRQCSELAWANIINSMSVGSRSSSAYCVAR